MNPAPPVTSTRTAGDATVAARWRRGCSGSPRASVRAARSASSSRWRGRAIRHRVELAVAYVLPWKDHLAGELEEAGVETVCLSTRRRDPRWPLRLRQLMATGGFDVVHSHSPVPAVAARLAARSLPRRSPSDARRRPSTTRGRRIGGRRAGRTGSRAALDAATFAVTEEVRASLRGTAAERAEVLVHGIDVDGIAARADGERAAIRAELGLRSDEIVIGTVANLRAQKDYPTLARRRPTARRPRRRVPPGRRRPGATRARDREPAATSWDSRPRRARRVPSGRRRGHGGVRRLRAGVGVGGTSGRRDGGRRARPADRGDRRRRHRRAVRADRRGARAAARPGRPRRRARGRRRRPPPAVRAVGGGARRRRRASTSTGRWRR